MKNLVFRLDHCAGSKAEAALLSSQAPCSENAEFGEGQAGAGGVSLTGVLLAGLKTRVKRSPSGNVNGRNSFKSFYAVVHAEIRP